MDNVSSSNTVFDFKSQAGVMALLSAVRASELSTADKNELRDLIFLYTNGGGDASVRITLEQKLVAHNIKPASGKPATAPVAAPKPAFPFGTSRPAPVFVPPVAPVVATPASVPQSAPVTVSAPAPVVEPVAIPTPVPEPVTAPVPEPLPVVKEVVPEVAVPTPVAPTPATQAPNAAPNNYIERIREIKTAVNSKVGNPVNLVDINNEVGREYMNALLEAMKSLSGGVAGGAEVAMQRLETAYLAVEVAISNHAASDAKAVENTPTPAPVVEPTPAPVPVPEPTSQPEVSEEPTVPEVVVAPAPAPVAIPTPESVEPAPEPEPLPTPVPVVVAPLPSEEPQVETSEPWVDPNPLVPTKSLESEIIPPTINNQTASPSQDLELDSINPADLFVGDNKNAAPDPLYTSDIDDGLQQLLSDWSLFKKSGLFGTGPKGIDHPLFKKISALPVHLLLAGRFEGSTQEIKQSITDYMNGWRYEQGIIYEQGESFEHYLRRVIRQILDLQKPHTPA
jgi:outer membrane biosynthesis protein TonB